MPGPRDGSLAERHPHWRVAGPAPRAAYVAVAGLTGRALGGGANLGYCCPVWVQVQVRERAVAERGGRRRRDGNYALAHSPNIIIVNRAERAMRHG